MRIAFMDSYLFEYRLPFLKALRRHADVLRVFALDAGFDLPMSKLQASGLDVKWLRSIRLNRGPRESLGWDDPTSVDLPLNVLYALRRFNPDVVISGDMGPRTLQAAMFRRYHPDCRLVVWARVSQHSERTRSSTRIMLRKELVRRADAIITNGFSGRGYLMELGANPSRVHVVHQASQIDARLPARSAGGPLRLLFVGRLIERKGLHLLLPALTRYAKASWTLTVAGDGPEQERLRVYASQHHLPVEFIGFVPRTGLHELFANHDVFVFPSLNDEWGLVVGEALRTGLPVLGSVYSEAVCELIEDGVTGWVLRPDDPGSIRIALDRVFSATSTELAHTGEVARRSVQQLTPEVMAKHFVEVIHAAQDS